MDNVVRMAVIERTHDLLEEPSSFVFGHLSSLDDVFEQFAGQVLDDHDNVGRRVDDVVPVHVSWSEAVVLDLLGLEAQFDDVRMSEQAQVLNLDKGGQTSSGRARDDAYLSVHPVCHFLIRNLSFANVFEGDFDACQRMAGHFRRFKSAFCSRVGHNHRQLTFDLAERAMAECRYNFIVSAACLVSLVVFRPPLPSQRTRS